MCVVQVQDDFLYMTAHMMCRAVNIQASCGNAMSHYQCFCRGGGMFISR